nr:MAG TPA: hypothetical protein [Caudoviricetes sp.]
MKKGENKSPANLRWHKKPALGAVRGYPCYEFCNVVLWKNSKIGN